MERYHSLTEKDISEKAQCKNAKSFLFNITFLFISFIILSQLFDLKPKDMSNGIFYLALAGLALIFSAIIATCMAPRYRQEYRTIKYGQHIEVNLGGTSMTVGGIHGLMKGESNLPKSDTNLIQLNEKFDNTRDID